MGQSKEDQKRLFMFPLSSIMQDSNGLILSSIRMDILVTSLLRITSYSSYFKSLFLFDIDQLDTSSTSSSSSYFIIILRL